MNEPEHPMEKALRGQATRRRAKAPVWTLSGAARERLHAEVGRVHRRRPKRGWLPLWLRLAGAAAALGLAVFWLTPPFGGPTQTAQAPQAPPATPPAASAPAGEGKDLALAAQPSLAEPEPTAAAAPVAAKAPASEPQKEEAGRQDLFVASRPAEPPVQLERVERDPLASLGKAEAAVSRLAASDVQFQLAPAQSAPAAAPPPAPGEARSFRTEASASLPTPALRVLEENVVAPGAVAETRELAAVVAVADLSAAATNAAEPRDLPAARFGFAAATPAAASLAQERELVRQAYSFRQAALPIPGPEVLRRFQLTRGENQVWVVDEDGSVYEPVPGAQGQAAGRANYFELVGTNKGLNQAVRFNGWILTNESSTAIMRRLAVPSGPPPGPVLQIQGSVKLGEGPELPIMANGSEISTNSPPP